MVNKQVMIAILALTAFVLGFAGTGSADEYVHGYTGSNGTQVQPYYRSSPDSSPQNNFSYPGNTNPYTGKEATGNPDTYQQNNSGRGNTFGGSNSLGNGPNGLNGER